MNESIESIYTLGDYYYSKQSYADAVQLYTEAAKQGHVQAQYKLGVCYATGTGIKGDSRLAVKWYLEAAKQGHVVGVLTEAHIWKRYWHLKHFRLQETAVFGWPCRPSAVPDDLKLCL